MTGRFLLMVGCAVAMFAVMGTFFGQPAAKKPDDAELRKKLTPEQYNVTQQCGTEPPFKNAYWDNHEDGIYVDVVSGAPLFSSVDKFDSGTGWPSFTRPLQDSALSYKDDGTHGMSRTEVRSAGSDSHLGHVFDDGPGPGGKRFCMNSASLRFIPTSQLKEAGLGQYLFMFADKKGWDVATLAGGCFWGMQEILEKTPGIIVGQVGYTGGTKEHATYEEVCSGRTGHAEALQLLFDPKKVSYDDLLIHFFQMHDPTTQDRQANDVGSQYRSAIFYRNPAQKKAAEAMITRVNLSGAFPKPVVTQLAPLGSFWRAEDYHQEYLEKHPSGYRCHVVKPLKF